MDIYKHDLQFDTTTNTISYQHDGHIYQGHAVVVAKTGALESANAKHKKFGLIYKLTNVQWQWARELVVEWRLAMHSTQRLQVL